MAGPINPLANDLKQAGQRFAHMPEALMALWPYFPDGWRALIPVIQAHAPQCFKRYAGLGIEAGRDRSNIKAAVRQMSEAGLYVKSTSSERSSVTLRLAKIEDPSVRRQVLDWIRKYGSKQCRDRVEAMYRDFVDAPGTSPQVTDDRFHRLDRGVADDVAEWALRSSEQLRTFLNYGPPGVRRAMNGESPQGMSLTAHAWWRHLEQVPDSPEATQCASATRVRLNPHGWTRPELCGFIWWNVQSWHLDHGAKARFPEPKEVRRLNENVQLFVGSYGAHQTHVLVARSMCAREHFPLLQHRLGRLGDTMPMNDHTIFHRTGRHTLDDMIKWTDDAFCEAYLDAKLPVNRTITWELFEQTPRRPTESTPRRACVGIDYARSL